MKSNILEDSKWEKLTGTNINEASNGVLFRCPAKWPYENWVDFLLVENKDSPSGYSLLVTSGLKSGLLLVHLPVEANVSMKGRGISLQWVKDIWHKWIYEIGPEGVYIKRRYRIDPNWISEANQS